MSGIIGVVPARMASSRFPGKPMELIGGIPMVGHVYMRCMMSKTLTALYVATCDKEIYDYIESIGGRAVMTGSHHERASDRIAEALLKIENETGNKPDIVVMIQGDEPMISPEMIDEAVAPMIADEQVQVVNLIGKIRSADEFEDPNTIKVVVDMNNDAIYFSREPIPTRKKGVKDVPMNKQICVIPFRRDYLIAYTGMEPTPLEIAESVDMLRVLEHGGKVRMAQTYHETYSVDTKNDLERVERMMKDDPLVKKYAKVRK